MNEDKSTLLDLEWEASLPYCNFVLLEPDLTGSDFSRVKSQMRRASLNVRACHRAEFSSNKTTFSIKQFLYDWAPPAYDHPCLWRNSKISSKENTPLPEAILLGNNYMWYGLDYRRKPAATINSYRTQVELTILEGDFIVDEVKRIIASLAPVSKNQKEEILNASLAELSHTHTYNARTISVPTGYIKHLRRAEQKGYFYSASQLPETLVAPMLAEFDIENYKLNSIFNFGIAPNKIDETEYYFEHTTHHGCYIRIMVTGEKNIHSIAYPAIVSDQACNFVNTNLSEQIKIYHAWSKRNNNGCHVIVCHLSGIVFYLCIKPAPWTSVDYARALCKKIAAIFV